MCLPVVIGGGGERPRENSNDLGASFVRNSPVLDTESHVRSCDKYARGRFTD